MKQNRLAKWVALFVVGLLSGVMPVAPAFAQGGTLDTTFGGDGKVTTNFTSDFDAAYGAAIQLADGKIIAAGEAAGSGGRFALARYDGDGTLDTTFGGDGKATTNITPGYDTAYDVAIQAVDGKIVAVGRANGSGGRFALARYETDGTLDSTFGGDGKVVTDFTSGDDYVFDVAIQPVDGKLVAVGEAAGSGGRFALARYNSDGTLDTTFGGDGKVITNFTAGYDVIDSLAIQPVGGRIVVAGTAGYSGTNAKFAVAAYDADGTLDTTFNADGKATTQLMSDPSWAFAIAIQPVDNKIVVGGEAGGANAGKFGLVRYAVDGTLDDSFGGDGKVVTNFTSRLDYIDDLAVQTADGKIVAAGSADFFGSNSRFALARYNSDGSLDGSFSGNGKVTTDMAGGPDWAFGLVLQPADGNVVAVGRTGGAGGRFALARYLAA